MFFSVEGVDLPPEVDPRFALWIALPDAMKRGTNLHLGAPADPVVLGNAHQISCIWSMWMPERFSLIEVAGEPWFERRRNRKAPFHLFSGGVDSTYSLRRIGRNEDRRTVLSVLALDYPIDRERQFRSMLKKTAPS